MDSSEYFDPEFPKWVVNNGLRNELGRPLSFKEHAFMVLPYADFFPQQAIMKSAQVGWSTEAILKSIYLLDKKKLNVIYTLPTVEDVRDFVPAKVDMMIHNNPMLVKLLGESDAMNKKQLGTNYIFYRGTSGAKAALMHTSDWNFYDEYDSCDPTVVDLYASRLQRSRYKGEMFFSNPTRPGGIDSKYAASDQRRWNVKCSKCGKWQDLDYFKNVCQERFIYQCAFCREELTDADRMKGEWIAKFPSRSNECHGYHINQLMVPWVQARELVKLQNTRGNAYFYNMVLGLPYLDVNERMDRSALMRAFRNKRSSMLRNVMGVDQKLERKHYVLRNADGVFKQGVVRTWEEIEELIVEYHPITVIDANPDPYPRRVLTKKYPGLVFCCIYEQNLKRQDLVRWCEGEEFGIVHTDRNEMISFVVNQIELGKIEFCIGDRLPESAAGDEWREFISHFENVYRKTAVNRHGIETLVWDTKSGQPDDFVHALAYSEVAMDKLVKGVAAAPSDNWTLADYHAGRVADEVYNAKMQEMGEPTIKAPDDPHAWIYN